LYRRNQEDEDMMQKNLTARAVQISVLGAAISLGATPALGESQSAASVEQDKICMAAFKTGQEREQAGRLVEASQSYQTCSNTACEPSLWQECVTRNAQLHAETPSVIPVVTGETGEPRTDVQDVQVKMDGELLASRLDGRALPVNPGTHEFSFATDQGVIATQKITITRGQRNRAVTVSMRAPVTKR